jgi:dolichol-phosphate mannosyltransferase
MQSGAKTAREKPSVQITDVPSIYPGHRILAMFPFYNEELKIVQMALRLRHGLVDKIVGVNDGSTDDGPRILRAHGIDVLDIEHTGAGACIRQAVDYGRAKGFDILVVMAGNNKDNPEEIPRLLAPIIEGHADYVQGSRFMKGGSSSNLPLFRLVAIKFLSLVFSAYCRQWCTDLTNGFRAYRLSLFDDPRINIWQDWLNKYEYEYYVHLKIYDYGYKTAEVAVTKTYPGVKGVPYTKVRPFSGWWQMLRPFVLLTLHLKK